MARFQIYLDEDSMDSDLVDALRSREVTVVTTLEASLKEAPDDRQLAYATNQACVIYTHNAGHFFRLHTEWLTAGRAHAGIIICPQKQFSIGEEARRILRIRAEITAEDMRSRIEFLTQWP